MRRLSDSDAMFILLESRSQPMHVGGLSLFTMPEEVDEKKFLAKQMDILKNTDEFRPPFDEVLHIGRLGRMYWKKDPDFDLDYHLRHSALPKPGTYKELFALISRLHGVLMDRDRPLWELHLIEGLQDRQFAMYTKLHHAAFDGAAGMHLMNSMMSTSKSVRINESPLSSEAYEKYKAELNAGKPRRLKPKPKELRNVAAVIKKQFESTSKMLSAFKRYGDVLLGRGRGLAIPMFKMPRSSLNSTISGPRRFVAQSWSMDRMKKVSKVFDGTLNDIVLAMVAGALRKLLISQNELPDLSLKAQAPVNVRREGDVDSGNVIAFIIADLATNIAEPVDRLRAIQQSMLAGKETLGNLSSREAALFAQITHLPMLFTSLLGVNEKFPAYSTVVSNVPGPKKPLYLNGARMTGVYPAGIVMNGFATSIIIVSYDGKMNFGITACRKSVPKAQRIIDYMEESLVELEQAAGLAPAKAKRAPRKKAAKTKAIPMDHLINP